MLCASHSVKILLMAAPVPRAATCEFHALSTRTVIGESMLEQHEFCHAPFTYTYPRSGSRQHVALLQERLDQLESYIANNQADRALPPPPSSTYASATSASPVAFRDAKLSNLYVLAMQLFPLPPSSSPPFTEI
jgi:hypothetical protein